MPKATVDEYGHLLARENDVRPTALEPGKRVIDPESEASAVELLAEGDLRCGVPAGLSRHAGRDR